MDYLYQPEYLKFIKELNPATRREMVKACGPGILKPLPDEKCGYHGNTSYAHDDSEENEARMTKNLPITNHHPVDDLEPEELDKPYQQLGERLRLLLTWILDAQTREERGDRVWVLAFALRPSLVNGSTLAEYGQEAGLTRQRIDQLVTSLRSVIGDFRGGSMRSAETCHLLTTVQNARLSAPKTKPKSRLITETESASLEVTQAFLSTLRP